MALAYSTVKVAKFQVPDGLGPDPLSLRPQRGRRPQQAAIRPLYVKHHGPVLDILILMNTIGVVVTMQGSGGDGAEFDSPESHDRSFAIRTCSATHGYVFPIRCSSITLEDQPMDSLRALLIFRDWTLTGPST